jgi:hypothetical protein
MDQDLGLIEPPTPSLPLPTSTPLLPPSLSQPPQAPPQFTQAGQPKWNYRLPTRYEDINPEPLQPLEEEDEQPTAVLPRLCLIMCNQLWTATNSFGLLREYLYRPSFDPDSFVSEEDLHQVRGTDPVSMPPQLGFQWLCQEMARALSRANDMWLAYQWLGSARSSAVACGYGDPQSIQHTLSTPVFYPLCNNNSPGLSIICLHVT